MTDQVKTQQNNLGCWLVIGVAILIVLLSQCTKTDPPSPTAKGAVSDHPFAIQSPAPKPQALSTRSAREGIAHFRKVASTSLEGSARLYSLNCYAGLEKAFTWSSLDRCGSFDEIAVQIADRGTGYFTAEERSYFGPEAAAQRYLTAATTAGLSGEEADLRFEKLQAIDRHAKGLPLIGARHNQPVASSPAATPEPSDPARVEGDELDG